MYSLPVTRPSVMLVSLLRAPAQFCREEVWGNKETCSRGAPCYGEPPAEILGPNLDPWPTDSIPYYNYKDLTVLTQSQTQKLRTTKR